MKPTVKDQCWIALAAGIVFFARLGATGLWDLDEPLYASCAREMVARGDWVVPMFNGEPFFDKPPLMFWLMMGGTSLFGQNEFAVRFFSAVIGVLTALATYHLGRRLFGRQAGLWSGLVVASTLFFTVSARAATVDAALTLASTLAIAALVWANPKWFPQASRGRQSPGMLAVPTHPAADATGSPDSAAGSIARWLMYVVMWAMMGVAVLAKGPVGLLLPAAAIGLFLMIRRTTSCDLPAGETWRAWGLRALKNTLRLMSPRTFLLSLWDMRPITGLIVVAAVALPWYVLVGLRTDGLWLQEFFAKYNLGPFVKPFMGHRGPFFYHFALILVGFFPWSLFLGPTLYHLGRRIRHGDAWAGNVLVACWAGVWFGFWSVCSTKLPHYVLPAYPALALATGCFLAEWLAEPARYRRAWSRNAAATLVIVGALLAIAAPIAARWFAPGEEAIALVGLPLVIGGLVCFHFHRRNELARMLTAFTVTGVVFLTALFAFAAARVDRHQHSPAVAADIRAASDGRPALATYRFMQASLVYYAGGEIVRFDTPESLRAYLDRAPAAVIVTTSAQEAELREQFGPSLRVVSRRPRFLGKGEVLAVCLAAKIDPAAAAARMPERR